MSSRSSQTKESSISVAVRVRPFTEQELKQLIRPQPENVFQSDGSLSSLNQNARTIHQPKGLRKILNVVDDRMLVFDPAGTDIFKTMAKNAFPKQTGRIVNSRIREHRFIFDRLFDEDASQEHVYAATTKPLLDNILDGFNATVFAYGATGCGKTHTITGTSEAPGIIFSTMQELFQKIDDKKDTLTVELTLSYLEIYNERIRDLLSPDQSEKPLMIQEDLNKRITVSNLSTYKPESIEHVMELILAGNLNRTVSPTEANATSSRSHAVLQINVDVKPRTANLTEQHTFATLSVIDLAGSERASATKNTGERLHEGATINKSLLALGNCINALCDPRRRNHVPYRDSKLTRLLKFSLGGNCKTVMIVCVSPSSTHYDETLNTLKYANRAKEIKTKVIRNQHNLSRHVGSYLKMITEQKNEIEELRGRENKMIDQAVLKHTLQRERNQKMMFEALDELSRGIAKYANIQMQKAYLLAKRKIIGILKIDLQNFLDSFDEIFNIEDNTDFTDFDSIIPGFSAILHKSETLLSKFTVQLDNMEKLYSKETEIDFIMNNTSKSISRRLGELEHWSSFDSLNFETHVSRLKDSVEKDILYQSSVFFDQSSNVLTSLKFPYSSFLNLLKCCLENETLNITNLQQVVHDIVLRLDRLINNDINLNISESVFASTVPSLPSPRKKGYKRSPSPLNKSPSKISKPKSPSRPIKQSKRVRWQIPANNSNVFQDNESSTDQSMDDSENDDSKDTPLHEKLQRGMNISPSHTSKNSELLKSFKSKKDSLISRKLTPPNPIMSSSNFSDPQKEEVKPHLPEDGSEIHIVGSLSPSRAKFNLGPPQRVFQPITPNSQDTIFHKSSLMSVEGSSGSIEANKSFESAHDSSVNKENQPIPSIFGDISSIF